MLLSARGKGFIRERRNVTYSARAKVVCGDRINVTYSARGMGSLGRDVLLQTGQG